ncbi:MAG TPA: ABC transporter permease [Bryobacteraceae bacterium]|jgi:predicted permease
MDLVAGVRRVFVGLWREPTIPVAATLTVALAIGANTAVFSIVDSILIRPLPYPGADRLYWISEHTGRSPAGIGLASDYYSLRERARALQDVAAIAWGDVNWGGPERPEYLHAAQVSSSFFPLMRTRPMLGRYLAPEEEGTKAPPVVVLSYVFWRNRLGGDRGIVGKTIVLDRQARTVIGVMPQGFDYPLGAQVWRPLAIDENMQRPRLANRPMRIVSIVAREKAGIGSRQLEGEMSRLTAEIRAEYPKELDAYGFLKGFRIDATPLQRQITGDLRPALLAITGAVGLVLLIACVNLANLLLARGTTLQRDLAVRLALGSTQARLSGQVLAESLMLALPGGAAGVAIAAIAVYVLNALKPAVLVRYPPISLDYRILAFTCALTVVTALVFGIVPALAASRVNVLEALKTAGHAHSGSPGSARIRRSLVVAELAVSLVLLIGASLLIRSFLKLAHVELGFPSGHLLTFQVNPIGSATARAHYYVDALARIQRLSMVRSAAISTHLPVTNWQWVSDRVQVVGRPPVPLAQQPQVDLGVTSAEYFPTVEMPLRSGRTFDNRDTPQSSGAIVVNEAFARRIFPGEDAMGKQILFGSRSDVPVWTIVGVVGNVRRSALGAAPTPLIYRCSCQTGADAAFGFIVRTAGDPKAAARAIEEQVYSVDRSQPVFDLQTMDDRVDAALAPARFQLILIGTFAGIALLLAAAGVYSVMAYLIGRRTREIGIRMAMGASPASVIRMVAGESGALSMVAVAAGLIGAWALTRYIKALLYGVTNLDPMTFVAAPILLALIVLVASAGPARRASRVDPLVALREE